MILSLFEQISIYVGFSENLLELDVEKWKALIIDYWIKTTWLFCKKYNISIKGEYSRPKFQRVNDKSLMDLLIHDDRKLFSKKDIKRINYCRIYLEYFFYQILL